MRLIDSQSSMTSAQMGFAQEDAAAFNTPSGLETLMMTMLDSMILDPMTTQLTSSTVEVRSMTGRLLWLTENFFRGAGVCRRAVIASSQDSVASGGRSISFT